VIEQEIKIPVDSLDEIRHRLVESGAERLHAGLREVNLLFDTADGSLASSDRVLRVRSVGERHVLTFKGTASYRGAIRERREIETEVASPERLIELLEALGYAPCFRYEKDRESWRLADVRIDLDHTPMGDFVELEGPSADLPETARALGLDPTRAVPGSYVSLWLEYRGAHPELGPDMVFDR
jgi:adenylate cyclase class 2